MQKAFVSALLLLAALLCAPPSPAAAGDYIGDTAIYTATSSGHRPNVLLVIDNSQATLNIASGVAYDPYSTYTLTGGLPPWNIYRADNLGNFSMVELANSTNTLENLSTDSCADIIRDRLLERGMYTGSGTTANPNIKFGNCDYNPVGEVYALGNYLNYLKQPQVSGSDVIVELTYTVVVGNKTKTSTDRFVLTKTHTAAVDNKPGTGANWQNYWSILGFKDTRPATHTWAAGTYFEVTAGFQGSSQRKIVYDAIAQVVGYARDSVNFGAMTYGTMNSGGKILKYPAVNPTITTHMADLSNDTAFAGFLTLLPGPGAADGAPVLSSATARPQAEALYDAGHYFGANYPGVSDYIAEPATIPTAIKNPCKFDHVILITNGLSNGDSGSASSFGALGDYDQDKYPTPSAPSEATYGNGSHYLDDIARYLKDNYNITTHTILAFQSEDDLVHKAANEGGGQFYNVFNANELAEALTKLLTNIVLETDTAFVAPVVPTNPENRTFSGQRVYLGFFYPKTQEPWHGNLKKFGISLANEIVDKNGKKATCPDSSDNYCETNNLPNGNFRADVISYWGTTADGGKVEQGGAGQKLMARSAARNIYTYPPGSSSTNLTHGDNAFTTSNSLVTAAALAVADDTEKNKLVNFMHGLDAYAPAGDLNNNGVADNAEKRDWIMGDILHAKPLVVNYNTFNYTNEGQCDWTGSSGGYNKSVIFAGANDGMLHAFRDCDGEELWAFIPPVFLPKLKEYSGIEHNIFLDSSATVFRYDSDGDGNIETADGDKVILLFGLRRGGSAYYALDVSNPLAPTYLWSITGSTSGFSELGQTWSEPQLGLVKDGSAKKVVAFVGAGYDNENEDRRFGNTQYFTGDVTVPPATSEGVVTSTGTATSGVSPKGRGVFAFEVATLDSYGVPTVASSPTLVWEFTPDTTNSINSTDSFNRGKLTYSFPGEVAPLDTDFDGFIDRLYIGDTGGRMWRMSAYSNSGELLPVVNPDINTWFGKIIFNANLDPSDSNYSSAEKGRKIFYRPSVVFGNGYIGVYFGTGDRAHPLNRAVVDRLYAVFDRGQRTALNINESNLVNVTSDLLQATNPEADPETCTSGNNSIKCLLERLRSSSNYGWYIRFDPSWGGLSGEKVLAPALVFNKVAYFTTYAPNPNASATDCVGNLGSSRIWAVDYKTGEAVFNFNTANDSDASTYNNTRGTAKDNSVVLNYADRFVSLGVGIPSGLVTLINSTGDSQVVVGSGGGIVVSETLPGGTIFPIYWMPW